jgi:hypothetical protein
MVTVSLTGRRCFKEAAPDTDPPRCERHLAINMLEKGVGCVRRNDSADPRLSELYMTRFYYRTLKPTLAARVTSMLEESAPLEMLGTAEELALIRIAANDAVKMYEDVVESGAQGQALLSAGALMSEQLKEVVRVAATTASIEETKQKIAGGFAHLVENVIVSIMRSCAEVFGDDYRVGELEKKIREHIQVRFDRNGASSGVDGTLLTPDMDVLAMDETVPRVTVTTEPHDNEVSQEASSVEET